MISRLTWGDFISLESGGKIPEEEYEDLLWGETCYPFGDVRTTIRQLRGAVRARLHGIERCEICGRPPKFCICARLMAKYADWGTGEGGYTELAYRIRQNEVEE